MKQVADISKLEFHHRQGGQFRWITITTLMLAIGRFSISYRRASAVLRRTGRLPPTASPFV